MTSDRKIVTLDDIERRHILNHRKPYFDWIRQIVSLSTASLTALIALQGSYLPSHPQLPFLLAICWLALLLTIPLGIFALRSEYQTPLDALKQIKKSRAEIGDQETTILISNGTLSGAVPPWHHRWSVRLMVTLFIISLSSLCAFAIVNIGELRG